jgi:hypothetical protein
MRRRFAIVLMFGVMVVALATAWSVNAGPALQTNYLTFRAPFGLPGVTLPAGTYAFEMADTNGSRDVVTVSSRDGSKHYFMGFTREVRRPAGLAVYQSIIVFREGPSDAPARIAAWYPAGRAAGREFLYER